MTRSRGGRVASVAGLVVIAVGAAVACEPGGLSGVSVAYTTDQTATHELERRHVDLSWLSCTADVGDKSTDKPSGRSSSPSARNVASVDCQGKTGDGKDVTVKGRVTRAVNGRCVRGQLRGTVGGRQVFRVDGLGDCDASATPVPPATYRPSAAGRPGRPGPTVTVTRTIWCTVDPSCRPVEGK
jgi:hypothetical protein